MKKSPSNILSRPHFAATLLLALTAIFQYANTLNHDYAWDDALVIQANPRVQEGISALPALFFNYQSQNLEDQYGYRPVTLSTFAIEQSIFGLQPRASHLINVLLYAFLVVLIYFTLMRMLPKWPPWAAFLVALLFAVHPYHVEVVANVKSRDELLAILFGMLALNIWLKGVSLKQWWRLPLAFVALIFGFLSRENAITFLALIPLTVLFLPQETLKTRIQWSAPMILGAVMLGGLLWLSNSLLSVEISPESGQSTVVFEHGLMGNSLLQPRTHAQTAATIFIILQKYLKTFLLPHPLVYYSGYNQIPLANWSNPLVYLSLIINLGLIFLAAWSWKRERSIALGIGFFYITLSPFLHIVRVLSDTMADRFMFAPSLGLCLALVGIGIMVFKPKTAKKGKKKEQIPNSFGKLFNHLKMQSPVFLGIIGVLVLGWMVRTWLRNPVWKDNYSLFSNDIEYLEDCARCHFHYADELSKRYDSMPPGERPGTLQEIIQHSQKATEITPEAWNSWLLLGQAHELNQDLAAAASTYAKMAEAFPEKGKPPFLQGSALWRAGQYAPSIPPLKKSVELRPENEDAYFFLGWAYFHTQKPGLAEASFEQGKQQFPGKFRFFHSKSDLLFETGDTTRAMQELQNGFAVEPNQTAYQMMVVRNLMVGDTAAAVQYQQEGLARGFVF